MASKVTVLAAPPGSGKTDRLLEGYRGTLTAGTPGSAAWLAPTWRAAAELRRRLLAGGCDGCFSPGVTTFDRFAEAVLQCAPVAVRPISRLMKRQLVRQLIHQQRREGRLEHFGSIGETGGLVDLVCEFIGELKRLEIWPEHFHQACSGRGITQKDMELLEIYDQYQRCLREHQLYDAEGRFWSARDRLEQGQRRPFERLRLVVADGFTDFTRTQHEILEILSGWVEELWIALPLEARPRRTELLAKPLKTLEELRRRHPQLVLEELPRPERPLWPAMAHIEKTVFADPRRAQPAEDTAGVEILAAAQQLGEIELIGARIKRLLTEGDGQPGGRPARPGEIAVVFRSPQDTDSLVGEVFGALGIPFVLETGHPLDRSPGLAALVALLRLQRDDWPFRQLLAVLTSNYFRPDWPEWEEGNTAVAAERIIRRLRIPRGRERLLGQIGAVGGDSSRRSPAVGDTSFSGSDPAVVDRRLESPPTDSVGPPDDWSDMARPTLALLERLAAAFDELPRQTGPAGWAAAWKRLARQTGLLREIERCEQRASPCLLPDRLAWDRLQEVLGAADTLDRWLEQSPTQWDRGQALEALSDILSSERVGQGDDESGRVRVLSAVSVRALEIPYLFLAGLSEKAFPPPQRVDRLYSEAEYQRLIAEGLPLVARTERSQEEMLLFYETITRARRRLYLSYPALDASAQPLLPSPYLSEVQQACGPGRITRTEQTDLSPIPSGDEPLSAAEFRIKALSTAMAGDVSLLAGLVQEQPDVAENVLAGLHLTSRRQERDGFGPAEGMLPGQAARRELSARFPPEHTFSATALERYAGCPYRFFLEKILKLELIEELALAVDYLERGRLAHDLLARFHRRVNQELDGPASPAKLEPVEYDRLLDEALAELSADEPDTPVRAALRQVDRRLVDRWLADYRHQHAGYDELWKECKKPLLPEFFEVSFGRKTDGEDPISTERPLEFPIQGETILISGRIDRIDTGRVAEQDVFNVVDYKTGAAVKFSRQTIKEGLTLQLPLYALAVAELLLADRDLVPWRAGYWYLKEKGFKPRQALKMYKPGDGSVVPEAEWEEMRRGLSETIAGLVGGIRTGQFPVCSTDQQCTGRCDYSTVCRVNQVRSLGKTWKPDTQGV